MKKKFSIVSPFLILSFNFCTSEIGVCEHAGMVREAANPSTKVLQQDYQQVLKVTQKECEKQGMAFAKNLCQKTQKAGYLQFSQNWEASKGSAFFSSHSPSGNCTSVLN